LAESLLVVVILGFAEDKGNVSRRIKMVVSPLERLGISILQIFVKQLQTAAVIHIVDTLLGEHERQHFGSPEKIPGGVPDQKNAQERNGGHGVQAMPYPEI